MSYLKVSVLVAGLALPSVAMAQDTAQYEGSFVATWAAESHPTAFPRDPHFSPLVGGTHNTDYVLFQLDGLATPGVKDVAETGNRNALIRELEAAQVLGSVDDVVLGPPVRLSPDRANFQFAASKDHPLLSIITMIAPSPDWIVGVSNLNLVENGQFIKSFKIPLFAIDAGTDSGRSFTSRNRPTLPPATIQPLTSAPLFVNEAGYQPFGYLELTLVEPDAEPGEPDTDLVE